MNTHEFNRLTILMALLTIVHYTAPVTTIADAHDNNWQMVRILDPNGNNYIPESGTQLLVFNIGDAAWVDDRSIDEIIASGQMVFEIGTLLLEDGTNGSDVGTAGFPGPSQGGYFSMAIWRPGGLVEYLGTAYLPPIGWNRQRKCHQYTLGVLGAVTCTPKPVNSLTNSTTAILTEYTLPVDPVNLQVDQGDIWFTSFAGNAIGRLAVDTSQVYVYTRRESGYLWGLQGDERGKYWYTSSPMVGQFDPNNNTFTEWNIPGAHYGIKIEPVTGDVWFNTIGSDANGIYKLSPSTNIVTAWLMPLNFRMFDLDIAPGGDVWFTSQPGTHQSIGRLNPSIDQVVTWTLPVPNSRPFRLVAESSDSIWFTQVDPVANGVAQLTPSTNTMYAYMASEPNSNPIGLLRYNDWTWFTEHAKSKIVRFDSRLMTPTITTLHSASFTTTKIISNVMPIAYEATAEVTPTIVATIAVTPTISSGVAEYALPNTNSGPFSIELAYKVIWFTEISRNRIGRLLTGP